MNRSDLIEVYRQDTGKEVEEAHSDVLAVFAAIKKCILTGDPLSIVGFGTWRVKVHAETRKGFGPAKGQVIPSHSAVKWKVSDSLKRAVRQQLPVTEDLAEDEAA